MLLFLKELFSECGNWKYCYRFRTSTNAKKLQISCKRIPLNNTPNEPVNIETHHGPTQLQMIR